MQLVQSRALRDIRSVSKKELGELHRWIEETPTSCTVKGMYIVGVLQALENRGIEPREPMRVQQFKDYPLTQYMELLLDAALTLYPESAPKEGLRRLGQLAVPTFSHSIVGAVIMSTVGRSWEMCLKMVSRGYELSLKPGKAVVADMTSTTALVQLRGVWNFGDSYQVGVLEGLMHSCDMIGQVTVQVISRADTDLRLEWEERAGRGRVSNSSPPQAEAR